MREDKIEFYEERKYRSIKSRFIAGEFMPVVSMLADAGHRLDELGPRSSRVEVNSGFCESSAIPILMKTGNRFSWSSPSSSPDERAVADDLKRVSINLTSVLPHVREVVLDFTENSQLVCVRANNGDWKSDIRSFMQLEIKIIDAMERSYLDVFSLNPAEWRDSLALAKDAAICAFEQSFPTENSHIELQGVFDLLLQPGRPAILFHEIAHAFESDLYQGSVEFGRTRDTGIRIFDDPSLRGFPGSMAIDDNGLKCARKLIFNSPNLVEHISVASPANPFGSNSRRASYRDQSLARQTVLIVEGNWDLDLLLAKCRNRLLIVDDIGYCFFDAQKGTVTAMITRSRVQGDEWRIGTNCQGILVSTPNQLLGNAYAVNEQPKVVPGSAKCGKRGQGVYVSYGCPRVLLTDIVLHPKPKYQ